VPGGNAADSAEIYQEGLRIPPSKIYERYEPNGTLFRIIENNVRVSDRVLGDLRSQIAALQTAERELLKVIDEYPLAELKAHMDGLVDHAERLTRAGLAALPDGTAEFDEWNDDDGAGGGPVKIHVKLTIEGDEAVIDFTGTSPQTSGALNPNFWFTASCSYAALRAVLPPGIPNNAGFYKPIKVIAPERCFVNPMFPAPVGARGQAGYRVRSAVLGALAQLFPERVPACPGGNEFAIVFAGYEGDHKPFLMLEFHNMTGMGGGPDADGQDAGPYCLGNVANVPVEVIEAEQPVMIEEYGFLPDTGGPGQYRGALGIVRQYKLLAEEATVQLRSDRNVFPPWGLSGGGPATRGRALLNPGSNDPAELPSKFVRIYRRGDVIRGEMPGSGGYGDPRQRDSAAVLEDVRQEKISAVHARDAYGVVIDPAAMVVDEAVTTELRAAAAAR
jgi:N-methylhydantoinase B